VITKRNLFGIVICILLATFCSSVEAQQANKLPRIGYLSAVSPSAILDRTQAFRQGLHQLGYVEGKTILIEWRYAEGKIDRLPALAAELVGLKVDVIVTGGTGATRPAKQATVSIPIVMTQDNDPVANGFIASLPRPGGNITGLSNLSPEISGKRLELLKEIVPRLSLVAVIGTSTSQDYAHELKEIKLAAGTLGLKLQHLDVLEPNHIEPAFRAANKVRADAVLWLVSGRIARSSYRREITDLAIKWRLPAIYENVASTEAGGLMSYGVSLLDLDRRSARYVDKILKGARPADLPVEQPTKFELIINLKTAKQIGLTIPPNVLARADRVIR
jgi:putative ABC transport system substrate-binding protein